MSGIPFRIPFWLAVGGLAAVGWNCAAPVAAQNFPQVVVLVDGRQYEGLAGSTEQINLGDIAPQPFEARNIASIDDGLRRVFVNRARMVANVQDSVLFDQEKKIPLFQKTTDAGSTGFGNWISYGPFNEYGHRTLTVRENDGKISSVVQGVTLLTPRYAILQTLLGGTGNDRNWEMRIPTGAIPKDILRRLLRTRITDPSRSEDFLDNIQFYEQARRFDEAIAESEFVRGLFPDLGERLKELELALRQQQARQILEEVRFRLASNQREFSLLWASLVEKDELARRINADFEKELADQQTLLADSAGLTVQVLADLESQIGAAGSPEEGASLASFSAGLQQGINPDTAARLDAYRLRSVDPQFTLQQKVALAISGWILGANYAIDNYAVARSLIDVQRLVREFLGGSADEARRQEIFAELEALEGAEPELLSRLLAQLGPAQPADLTGYTGAEPVRFTVTVPGTAITAFEPQVFECLAHLPPGYSTAHEYPLLLTLGFDRDPQRMLDYWCGSFNEKLGIRQGQAIRYGFVTVSVNWLLPGQNQYGHSAREHAVVLAAVRESLRKFSVDSDRVILHGMYSGATAAYDIGISHPDLFAGVAGVSGAMKKYSEYYRTHQHPPLAVYSVVGEKDTACINDCVSVWNAWLQSNTRYNLLTLVMYRGRLAEPFPEEQEPMLDWAARQLRYWPTRSDAIDLDCAALRPFDNFFWFYEVSGIPAEHLMTVEEWKDKDQPRPVTLRIQRTANQSNLFRLGPVQSVCDGAVLWLSEEFADFSQKVEIDGRGRFKDFVTGSRRTMLEDVRQRGDRKHPFWAKIVERNKRWSVEE